MILGFCLIQIIWLCLALVFLLALCVHKLSLHLPTEFENSYVYLFFQDLIRYGKTKRQLKRDNWLRVFDVPKRWFWHFYAVSVAWNGVLIGLSLYMIVWGQPYPAWLTDVLGFLTGERKVEQVPQVSAVLVLALFWLHSVRRLAECVFVSVFSDGVIHVVQYMFGMCYYILLGLTVLCSDHYISGEGPPAPPLLSQVGWLQAAGALFFSWSSLLQHRSLVLLARLRTGPSGRVQTLAHSVPSGGWFQLVSCPHYLAELLVYASLGLVSGGPSPTWGLVLLYVLSNQALAALLCHQFYRSTFPSYPPHRRALIPYLF